MGWWSDLWAQIVGGVVLISLSSVVTALVTRRSVDHQELHAAPVPPPPRPSPDGPWIPRVHHVRSLDTSGWQATQLGEDEWLLRWTGDDMAASVELTTVKYSFEDREPRITEPIFAGESYVDMTKGEALKITGLHRGDVLHMSWISRDKRFLMDAHLV